MEAGQVRNPSAYVFRGVSNCKKTSLSTAASSRFQSGDFLAEFRNGNLDDDVLKQLERIGPIAAEPILNDCESKMANGEVRNPSAYVMRAISNHDKGGPEVGAAVRSACDAAKSFSTFAAEED